MSLEAQIQALTEAVAENTKALLAMTAAGVVAPAAVAAIAEEVKVDGKKAEETKPEPARRTRRTKTEEKPAATEAPASKRSRGEMQAALNEVKEVFGTSRAKKVIADAGFEKMADITEDKFDEVYDTCKSLIESAEESDDEGDL